MGKEYLLGVDIGTYSSKGVLVSKDGAEVAGHVIQHDMSMPAPGYFEHDADGVWWHDFVEIVRNLLATSGIHPGQILGIGTSAIGPCVLPIDAQGRPLRPGIRPLLPGCIPAKLNCLLCFPSRIAAGCLVIFGICYMMFGHLSIRADDMPSTSIHP